jgi:glycosyltransferase involved in cell wall biosynthesis
MASLPFISIVINNYNYAHYLIDAIESALAQTYPFKEIIVVDDGSTDNSQQIIKSYGDKIIPFFKFNGGQASAFNTGYTHAKGEFILFLDADDYLNSQALEEIVPFIQPHMSRLQFDLKLVDQNKTLKDVTYIQHYCGGMIQSGDLRSSIFQGQLTAISTSGNLFPKKILDKLMPIPEEEWKICTDAYLVWLGAFYGPVISVLKALGYYRIHQNNQWASLKEEASSTIVKQFLLQRKLQELIRKQFPTLNHWTFQLDCMPPNDINFWKAHLISRILEPQCPITPHSRYSYFRKGIRTVWSHPTYKWTQKLRTTLWFILAGIFPIKFIHSFIYKSKFKLPFQPNQFRDLPPLN